ncbi:MAG TPA: diphosphomevalonate decarboxylase [Polyangiaceae bacterium]|nr:diphosphomevalonate decarboxylase [Polyangiaceae bacterium]
MTASRSARARAHANIALAKYWGKADVPRNLTAVPSLSLTLSGMRTTTEVTFAQELAADELTLGGAAQQGKALQRVSRLLAEVRGLSGVSLFARVRSHNDFPTAAGLASSASGFAALALAAAQAAGLSLSLEAVSALARAASASAARSLYGGFVELAAGAETAARVAPPEHWPLCMLVAVTSEAAKETGSTEGMQHTAATSPYYAAWLGDAPRLFEEVKQAVLARDFERLAPAVEQSALMMHASMLAARPALLYFRPATLAVIEQVRALRRAGTEACFTIDAGPHVKVLVALGVAARVEQALAQVPGVLQVLASEIGPDARILAEGEATEALA